eukprot:236207-Lingulodinium_polyedra.AAC.1
MPSFRLWQSETGYLPLPGGSSPAHGRPTESAGGSGSTLSLLGPTPRSMAKAVAPGRIKKV